MTAPTVDSKRNNKRTTLTSHSSKKFPAKLHDMMAFVESKGLESIISWVMDGTGFMIHDPEKIVALLSFFFQQTQYRSFRRQLNMWNFDRVQDGPNKGAFVHPHFVRGKKDLCRQMSRQCSKHFKKLQESESGDLRQSLTAFSTLRNKQSVMEVTRKSPIAATLPFFRHNDLTSSEGQGQVCCSSGASESLEPTPLQCLPGVFQNNFSPPCSLPRNGLGMPNEELDEGSYKRENCIFGSVLGNYTISKGPNLKCLQMILDGQIVPTSLISFTNDQNNSHLVTLAPMLGEAVDPSIFDDPLIRDEGANNGDAEEWLLGDDEIILPSDFDFDFDIDID